jgi:hypothetical protein
MKKPEKFTSPAFLTTTFYIPKDWSNSFWVTISCISPLFNFNQWS